MKFVSFVSYRYHSVAHFRPLNLPVNFIFHNIIMHWMEWSIFCQHQSAMDDLSENHGHAGVYHSMLGVSASPKVSSGPPNLGISHLHVSKRVISSISSLHIVLLKILRMRHCTAKDARYPCKGLEKKLIGLIKYWYELIWIDMILRA